MDEATAFRLTLESTDPRAPTACTDWTAHELVAHLAAGAAEMAGHAERALRGAPARARTAFEEREAPFVGLEDRALRVRLVDETLRLQAAVDELSSRGLGVVFSDRCMSAGEIALRGRSEAALHRWDLCGDDQVGDELLGQPELTAHALGVLNSMAHGSSESPRSRACRAGIEGPARFVLESPGELDVVVKVDRTGGAPRVGGRLGVADRHDRPGDSAARPLGPAFGPQGDRVEQRRSCRSAPGLLLVGGRRPDTR